MVANPRFRKHGHAGHVVFAQERAVTHQQRKAGSIPEIKTLLSDRPIRTQHDVAELVANLKAEVERRVLAIEGEAVLQLIEAGHHLHEAAAIVRSCRPASELAAVVDDINEIERAADRVRLGTN